MIIILGISTRWLLSTRRCTKRDSKRAELLCAIRGAAASLLPQPHDGVDDGDDDDHLQRLARIVKHRSAS